MTPEGAGITGAVAAIEAVAAADAEAIALLAAEIWRVHYKDIISGAQIEYMLNQRYSSALIRSELARGVAWDKLVLNGAIIGYASYLAGAQSNEMKLDKLYVHQDHQRKGYGGRLIERAATAARAAGCGTLMLAVNKANVNAIAAYAKHGFRIRESVVQQIGGGFVMDDYFMVKDV